MKTNEIIKSFIVSELISDGKAMQLTDTYLLIDSGIIDSLGIMALMSFLEEKFSIKIATDELMPENFDSIAAISALVDKKLCDNREA